MKRQADHWNTGISYKTPNTRKYGPHHVPMSLEDLHKESAREFLMVSTPSNLYTEKQCPKIKGQLMPDLCVTYAHKRQKNTEHESWWEET
eukprot:4241198-Ditylum_brightwellii.AAC.1